MNTETKSLSQIETEISAAFRRAFESHPDRDSDSAWALDSARETAAELIPAHVDGRFDDVALRFYVTDSARDEDVDAD